MRTKLKILALRIRLIALTIFYKLRVYVLLPSILVKITRRVEALSDEIQAFADLIVNQSIDVTYLNNEEAKEELKEVLDSVKAPKADA